MYVKIHHNILTSSLWSGSPAEAKIWITLLALADPNGLVEATAPGIATLAHIPLAETRKILQKFQEPDPDSRTPDNEGRRIEKIDAELLILNYVKYREMLDPVKIRAQTKLRVAVYRERVRNAALQSVTVTQCNDTKTKTKTKTKKELNDHTITSGELASTRGRTRPKSENSPKLPTRAKKQPIEPIAGPVQKLLAGITTSNPTADIARLFRATNDRAFHTPGWKAIITAVSNSPLTHPALQTLIDRIEVDVDPRLAAGRDHDWIKNPARFASAELKRLEEIIKTGGSKT